MADKTYRYLRPATTEEAIASMNATMEEQAKKKGITVPELKAEMTKECELKGPKGLKPGDRTSTVLDGAKIWGTVIVVNAEGVPLIVMPDKAEQQRPRQHGPTHAPTFH